ncbi:HD family phosphohydrolase [Prolixibacter sp. NT017]|uniref:HD family phosphohydrolase n=1 Tax=Prolixibacter sp. NT017 TaxID=2652390 RepID=UPI00126B690A|nr:HDIG domain-containing metalloprotein [Prolixibacter sp. NT017]GET25702.1 HDIG domain-containing protein [Prolixibacter sp. NT017]
MNIENKLKSRESFWHTTFVVALFVITTILIYLALPGEARFKYEFQKGRPWMHETLIAPFDFAVLKSDDELKAERDSVLNAQLPYFTYQDSIGKEQIAKLKSRIDNLEQSADSKTTANTEVKDQLVSLYQEVFKRGILEQSISDYAALKGKSDLMLVEDHVGRKVPLGSVFSLKTAYNYLSSGQQQLADKYPSWQPLLVKLHPEVYIHANLVYDEKTTDFEKQKLLDNISTSRGMVQEGERIVSQGDLVTPDVYRILESLQKAYENRLGSNSTEYYGVLAGKAMFILLLVLVLFLFVFNIRRELLNSKRDIAFTLLMTVVMIYFCRLVVSTNPQLVYLVPFTVLALTIRTFLDARLAIFVNTIAALIVGFMVPNGYEFVLLQILAGTVAVISQDKLLRRGQLVITSVFILLTYVFAFIGISLIQEGNWDAINWMQMRWFVGNAVLTLITYLLVYIFEKSFGFVSDVTLIELSYSNQNLLRKLAEEAPGTFQHSLQVANLAEDAITKLGGNPLLVRTGAMYHDIGKTKAPHFFAENQAKGINPHEEMSLEESAQVIMNHVPDGVALAKKYKIPEMIINFIRTHHGTTKTGYFYLMSKNENPEQQIDASKFTYPGPVPSTRETAVVMLADSIEAASRSLKDINGESLSDLIDKIFNSKIKDGQLDYAPLTFQDITLLKQIFLEKLLTIYHVRMEYPDEKKVKKVKRKTIRLERRKKD